MKIYTIGMAMSGALFVAGAASAANIGQIDAQFSRIDASINQGLRSGSLTGPERDSLRGRYQTVMALKTKYAADGYTAAELADLSEKLDRIEAGVRKQARDEQSVETRPAGNFMDVDARIASVAKQIDAGVAAKQLTPGEASSLRERLEALKAKTAEYRADNLLSTPERQDINTRLAALNAGVARQRNDAQGQ